MPIIRSQSFVRSVLLSACALLALVGAQVAIAQGGPAARPGPGADCQRARDPARCEAMAAVREACSGLSRGERRECVRTHTPAKDCSKALHPERCALMQKAHEACRDKAPGPDMRACMRAQIGPIPSAPPAKPAAPPASAPSAAPKQ